jgi:hypothetical protein
MNPFNPEAGMTPFPIDPLEVAVTEAAARLIWRACPYFGWRYAERGRRFGLSDAGFIVTLAQLPIPTIEQQLDWLVRLLAPRGMPGVLMEVQLRIFERVGRRAGWTARAPLTLVARRRSQARASVLSDETLHECEMSFRAATQGLPHAFGTGHVLAGVVADAAMGISQQEDALLRWLIDNGPSQPEWRQACCSCLELARSRVIRPQLEDAPSVVE